MLVTLVILIVLAAVFLKGAVELRHTLLIAPTDYQEGGKAAGRAIASWPTSTSAPPSAPSTTPRRSSSWASPGVGHGRTLHLIPCYLPRFGMAPRWAALSRPLVLVLFAVDVVVTLVFRADVEAQSGAYARGVLVLILSAAFAATLTLWRERRWGMALYTGAMSLVFGYTLADNCVERPDGLIIDTIFTLLLMLACALSRPSAPWRCASRRASTRTSRAGGWDRSSGGRRCTSHGSRRADPDRGAIRWIDSRDAERVRRPGALEEAVGSFLRVSMRAGRQPPTSKRPA